MKLHRPYIPLSIRVQVAERQLLATHRVQCNDEFGIPLALSGASYGARLKAALFHLSSFGTKKMELHHRPALVNRKRTVRNGKVYYTPPANSVLCLVYLPADDHDIETRVRGLRGQHSDLGLARKRKRKRKERKKTKPKTKWPSRPLRSTSRWPKARNFNRKHRKTQP